ncbi:hypothetical protein ASPTUDRAFT_27698 [Aspergillus tubingensis CBS 134.48]|uniref:Uncharacterized protein n=1 Tax=Aspergillus tubingensis (strain CBS 134.48) TaxID=767770 RepID=A0A1L9NBQ3_ASPTC|nr:hypothetical protein ASPTUDRAFT_27698 [Aspergillus tubingensis CBS 134.48]
MKFEYSPKRYWEDYGPNKVWNNEAMGKWAILKLSDDKLYWCYGDGGEPCDFGRRKGIWTDYEGFINTWSRDFHVYSCDSSFEEVEEKLGSGNVWGFSSGEFDEYGTFLQGHCMACRSCTVDLNATWAI